MNRRGVVLVAAALVVLATTDTTETLATDSRPLQSGEETTTTFENATCGDTVTIHATGDGVSATLERTIDC